MDEKAVVAELIARFTKDKIKRILGKVMQLDPDWSAIKRSPTNISGFPPINGAYDQNGVFKSRQTVYSDATFATFSSSELAIWAKADLLQPTLNSSLVQWVAFVINVNGTVSLEKLGYNAYKIVASPTIVTLAEFKQALNLALCATAGTTDNQLSTASNNPVQNKQIKTAIDTINASIVSGAVQKVAFDNANASLDGIKIGTTTYKVVPCGNASGTNSIASGLGSTASGAYSIASGTGSTASGGGSVASGNYSTASGGGSVASGGSSVASRGFSVAIGNKAISNITRWVSFDGNNDTNADPQNNYITAFSPDYFLFRNADVNFNATATTDYADLKTLTDYLGTGAPTIVTETSANILAGTSAYFTRTGSGTSGDPYIVTPKADIKIPHAHRVYQITMSVPTANTYIRFKGSGTETCMVEIVSNNAAASFSYFMNFYDLYSHVRSRNKLNAGTLVATDIDSKTSNAEIYIDLNGYGMYTTNAI